MTAKGLYRYLRLTYFFTTKDIKGMLTYRWSFLANCISQALDYSVTFLLMWIMVSAFDTMNGWNAYEVMLLYAFSLIAYGIPDAFLFDIMKLVPGQILKGTFDDVLVKPVKILPYLISSSFICNYIAHMTLSVVIIAVCMRALKLPFTWLFWGRKCEATFQKNVERFVEMLHMQDFYRAPDWMWIPVRASLRNLRKILMWNLQVTT